MTCNQHHFFAKHGNASAFIIVMFCGCMRNGSNKLVFGNSDITENSYFELKGFILTKKVFY